MARSSEQREEKSLQKSIVVTILINGVVPLIVYEVLLHFMTSLNALLIATCIPALDNLVHLRKFRRLDVFGVFMLLGFVLGIVMAFISGNEHLILIRESFVTSLLGLFFLISLLFPKPLIYYFALRFTRPNEIDKQKDFSRNWEHPYFRFVMRFMTLVWGLSLLCEAVLRVILVHRLTTEEFLAMSGVLIYGFLGATILWTIYYRRHAAKRFKKMVEKDYEVKSFQKSL